MPFTGTAQFFHAKVCLVVLILGFCSVGTAAESNHDDVMTGKLNSPHDSVAVKRHLEPSVAVATSSPINEVEERATTSLISDAESPIVKIAENSIPSLKRKFEPEEVTSKYMAKYNEHSFPMAAGNDAATPPVTASLISDAESAIVKIAKNSIPSLKRKFEPEEVTSKKMAKYNEHSFPMAAGNDAATPSTVTEHEYIDAVNVYGLFRVAIGIENWKLTEAAKASLLERVQFMTWQKTPGYEELFFLFNDLLVPNGKLKEISDKVRKNYDEFLRATGKNRIRERV
ncbi:unnamed protein product [Peronospora belbahrii]|uniref:RxLR effector protein n=1 Tax=Peronospora belbahrii TaxID=622444 RepID=A0ABN8CQU3_9STRA|nr:unnamed protein product [Peronospora belbahrii]